MKTASCYAAIILAVLGGIALCFAVYSPMNHVFYEQCTFFLLGASAVPGTFAVWEKRNNGPAWAMIIVAILCPIMAFSLPL